MRDDESEASVRSHNIKFAATQKTVTMLQRLQELFPGEDLDKLTSRAFGLLLAQKDPEQRQMRRVERQAKKAGKAAKTNAEETSQTPPPVTSDRKCKIVENPRRPEAAIIDAVKVRDKMQCTYTAPDGKRCESRRYLEIDHILPFAFGGSSTDPLNLRVHCSQHNRLLARNIFGDKVPRRQKG